MSTQEPVPLPLSLGRQFAAARERIGLDQDELGERLGRGYDRSTISRWERDKQVPPFDVVVQLSEMSDWDLRLFARASTPPSPDDPPGQEISRRGCNADILPFRPRSSAPSTVAA